MLSAVSLLSCPLGEQTSYFLLSKTSSAPGLDGKIRLFPPHTIRWGSEKGRYFSIHNFEISDCEKKLR
jgi:hypothetical protein